MTDQEAEYEAVRTLRLRFAHDVWSDHIPKWIEHVKPRFAERESVRALEVGSLEGRSAIWTARNVLTPSSTITCVDTFDAPYEINFDYNIAAAGVAPMVVKVKGRSEDVLAKLSPGYDLAYIDANHDTPNVMTDAVLCWRLLSRGGLLVFDDYPLEIFTAYGKDGPRRAIDNFIATYARQLSVIETGWQVFVEKL